MKSGLIAQHIKTIKQNNHINNILSCFVTDYYG
jgi:hypothetical protein